MDKFMNYQKAKGIVDSVGWGGFVEKIEKEFNTSFYQCSVDWYDNSKYICKLKGQYQDVCIGWEDESE